MKPTSAAASSTSGGAASTPAPHHPGHGRRGEFMLARASPPESLARAGGRPGLSPDTQPHRPPHGGTVARGVVQGVSSEGLGAVATADQNQSTPRHPRRESRGRTGVDANHAAQSTPRGRGKLGGGSGEGGTANGNERQGLEDRVAELEALLRQVFHANQVLERRLSWASGSNDNMSKEFDVQVGQLTQAVEEAEERAASLQVAHDKAVADMEAAQQHSKTLVRCTRLSFCFSFF